MKPTPDLACPITEGEVWQLHRLLEFVPYIHYAGEGIHDKK